MSTIPPILRSASPLIRPRTLPTKQHKYLPSSTRSISTRSPALLPRTYNPRTSSSPSTITSSPPLPTTSSIFKRLFGSFATAPSEEAMSDARTKAEGIIADNAVVVFSKSYCPYCKSTKTLLQEAGAPFFQMELDQVDDGPAIQDALEDITGQRSVPNIFINHKHIGGNSELQGRKSELPALLKEAGAV